MSPYAEHLGEILQFKKEYENLIDSSLVDFFVQDLWTNCLPDKLKSPFEEHDIENFSWDEYSKIPAFNEFVSLAKSLALDSRSSITSLDEFLHELPFGTTLTRPNKVRSVANVAVTHEYMHVKKQHEVQALGLVVSTFAKSISGLVIDAGAGKAYLSTYLGLHHELPVLAMDSSTLCQKGAINRQRKIEKNREQSKELVRYIIEEINDSTDYPRLVSRTFPEWDLKENLVLTGLHTCGPLAHSVIRSFLNTKDIKSLCIVPCCYHLVSETLGREYFFSKNARMLAQQSWERSIAKRSMKFSLLFYRAILQVLLQSMEIRNARVGRAAPAKNFTTYARWAFKKIGVEPERVPSVEELDAVYRSYAHWEDKFRVFHMLRVYAGAVLEAALVLDRVVHLEKSGRCSKLAVLRLFDPLVSPRRYAILAVK